MPYWINYRLTFWISLMIFSLWTDLLPTIAVLSQTLANSVELDQSTSEKDGWSRSTLIKDLCSVIKGKLWILEQHVLNVLPFISSFAKGDFCRLPITFASSLNPVQDRQYVCPDLDPNPFDTLNSGPKIISRKKLAKTKQKH